AETPLVSEKGDPILAHWQYGLGRTVAFTSDARAKWGQSWLNWLKYRQFWSQAAQWSLRKVDAADFNTDVTVDKGEGEISVEALDATGNFRNFLTLEAVVVSPKGDRQTVQLQQTGPGHYDAKFPTKEVGAYLINLLDKKDGKLQGSQVLGASVNYSPEFNAVEPNLNLLQRIAEAGGGRILDLANPSMNPYEIGRKKTFQPRELWEWLLKLAIVIFLLDVAVRRIQIDKAEWLKATENLRRTVFFWKGVPRTVEADESLGALLARRDEVRTRTAPKVEPNPDLFRPVTEVREVNPTSPAPSSAQTTSPAGSEFQGKKDQPQATSSAARLLEAKRRALKKDK
ncbi:MAG: VWA domain-containing protein, partial [Limisphaerales bacterium]